MNNPPDRGPGAAPSTHTSTNARVRWNRWWIGLLIVAGVAALAWSQLPRGPYSTDLTRLGQGRAAMVLAYDNQSMGGMEVMAMMDKLRPVYEDRLHFLVAPLGAPQGQAFGQQHGAVNGTVVFFSPSGRVWRQVHLPPDADALRGHLEGLLASAP